MINQFVRWAVLIGLGALAVSAVACSTAAAAPAPQATATATSPLVTPTPTSAPGGASLSDIASVGTGRVFAQPDTAIANLGVEIIAPTLEQATKDASTRMDAVLAKIKSMGIDSKDITTTSYNVNPETNNPKEGESPRIVRYRVSNIVQVRIRKIDDAGKIIDAAIGAGANAVYGLSFTVEDPSSFQRQARSQAVKDAMAKAQNLADAAGVKLGRIIAVTESAPPRVVFDRGATQFGLGAAGGGAGPIEGGQTEIIINVEVHFSIAQ